MATSPARSVAVRRALELPLVSPRIRGLAVGAWAEVLLVATLMGLAGAIRWPYLLLSPQFPSVGAGILMAVELVDGRAFPLADDAPYIGAPFIYLLATVYKLLGPSVEVTLLVPWAIGALTVVPTYLLGRELAGRMAGLLGGALLATAGAHIVVTSHVPMSHSLTPLCSTFTLWLLARAVVRRSGWSLALAGLGAGLTLQTHPTVLPLLVGSAAAVLLVRPAWLRTRWPYVALVLVVVGYSTLLANHIRTGFMVVADIESKQGQYLDGGEDVDGSTERGIYLANLADLSVSLARMASGEIDERSTGSDYLSDPWILSYPALAVLGALIAARRGNPLLLVALALAIFWPPLLSGKYKPILDGRYLMPDLPVIFVDVAVAVGALTGLVLRGTPAIRLTGGALLLVGAVALVLHPLTPLERFYEESQEDGFSNVLYLRTLHQVQAARRVDEAVLLDPRLADVKSTGGGKASTNFAWLTAVSRIPAEQLDTSGRSNLTGRLAILHRSTADNLDNWMRLEPLDGKRANGKDSPSYRAYRIGSITVGRP